VESLAISVVFHHASWCSQHSGWCIRRVSDPVACYLVVCLHAHTSAVGGLEAVIVFYVLSGFVLAITAARINAPSYTAFTVKRFCRIYIPYAGSL